MLADALLVLPEEARAGKLASQQPPSCDGQEDVICFFSITCELGSPNLKP